MPAAGGRGKLVEETDLGYSWSERRPVAPSFKGTMPSWRNPTLGWGKEIRRRWQNQYSKILITNTVVWILILTLALSLTTQSPTVFSLFPSPTMNYYLWFEQAFTRIKKSVMETRGLPHRIGFWGILGGNVVSLAVSWRFCVVKKKAAWIQIPCIEIPSSSFPLLIQIILSKSLNLSKLHFYYP